VVFENISKYFSRLAMTVSDDVRDAFGEHHPAAQDRACRVISAASCFAEVLRAAR
jgi:hypothetical protein